MSLVKKKKDVVYCRVCGSFAAPKEVGGSEMFARKKSFYTKAFYKLKAGSHVRRKHKRKHKKKYRVNRGNASTRKRNIFLLLTLALVLASSRFTRTFSCACACACACACTILKANVLLNPFSRQFNPL